MQGYELTTNFEHIDGIRDGGDVRISGIKVGSVLGTTLDPKTFLATVRMSVEPSSSCPTTRSPRSFVGLLGTNTCRWCQASDKDIPPNGRIKFTQSSVSIEHLIGQMMFSPPAGKKPGENDNPQPPSNEPAPQK